MALAAAAAAGAVIAALASALVTLAWISLAKRWRLEDEPGQRRLHADPTPRGGGVGVAVGWAIGLAAAIGVAHSPLSSLSGLLMVGGAYFLCGLVDDFRALPALAKLLLQVLAALFVFTPLLPAELRGHWPALALLWLGLLYFVNAWNFMDGSNGMIGIQSLLVALAVGSWPGQAPGLALAAYALAGACAGFLPLNFPHARVFLGDSGSLLLGSALFVLLYASCVSGAMHPVQALLLASVVLVDTALTLARRVLQGKRFWRAHREHLYQFAVRRGHGHARVAVAYGAATVLAWLLALSLQGRQGTILALVVPTLAWGGAAATYLLLRRRWLSRGRLRMQKQA